MSPVIPQVSCPLEWRAEGDGLVLEPPRKPRFTLLTIVAALIAAVPAGLLYFARRSHGSTSIEPVVIVVFVLVWLLVVVGSMLVWWTFRQDGPFVVVTDHGRVIRLPRQQRELLAAQVVEVVTVTRSVVTRGPSSSSSTPCTQLLLRLGSSDREWVVLVTNATVRNGGIKRFADELGRVLGKPVRALLEGPLEIGTGTLGPLMPLVNPETP